MEERVTWAEVHAFWVAQHPSPTMRASKILEGWQAPPRPERTLLQYVMGEHPPKTEAEWEAARAEFEAADAIQRAEWEGENTPK